MHYELQEVINSSTAVSNHIKFIILYYYYIIYIYYIIYKN
jgi:hypothetical protein